MSDFMAATIAKIAAHGKGILAADESNGTIGKRFTTIDLENTEENRCRYRSLLATTPGLGEFISGVILFEETLYQKTPDGKTIPEAFEAQGIVPGIKVDKGLVAFESNPDEKITQGLDGLPERLAEYKKQGARFAKWRAVFSISDHLPTQAAIKTHAENLARYAAICQAQDIVPIVEPEVLMDGKHTLADCEAVTTRVLHQVFNSLYEHKVSLEHMILKPNMVISALECPEQASSKDIAIATLRTFARTVPAAVPTINFLSGGQSPQAATENLAAINAFGEQPWTLSFSYGRGLQADCLAAWQGQDANREKAQKTLLDVAKQNSDAAKPNKTATMAA